MPTWVKALDGATPDHAMTYIAIHEAKDGRAVEFRGKVTDEQYRKGPPIPSSRRQGQHEKAATSVVFQRLRSAEPLLRLSAPNEESINP